MIYLFMQVIKKLNASFFMSGWYETKCPFHKDEGNSMIFSEEGFHCVGCGATGTLKQLAAKAGVMEVKE